MGENHGRKDEVECSAELLPWCATKLRIDPVLNHPYDKASEAAQNKGSKPEGLGERLLKDPHALP